MKSKGDCKASRVAFERSCICCKAKKTKSSLKRVSKFGDEICLDLNQNLPGRGCYVCDQAKCIQTFVAKKVLNRAYKTSVSQAVYDNLLQQLTL